jgi:hypothetical protein
VGKVVTGANCEFVRSFDLLTAGILIIRERQHSKDRNRSTPHQPNSKERHSLSVSLFPYMSPHRASAGTLFSSADVVSDAQYSIRDQQQRELVET